MPTRRPLSIACHDAGLHEDLAPPGGEARDVFEAIEQARVEAIGAQRMEGVAANLAARIEQRYERSRLTRRPSAPRRRCRMHFRFWCASG